MVTRPGAVSGGSVMSFLDIAERRDFKPLAIFDVRDVYLEQLRNEGLSVSDRVAATVQGPLRFEVRAIDSPHGHTGVSGWILKTRRTLSGASVFAGEIIEEATSSQPAVVRSLVSSAGNVDVRVSSPRFQYLDVSFAPGGHPPVPVNLLPGVNYPFWELPRRPDGRSPGFLRGVVLDDRGRGISGAAVSAAEALFPYQTDGDGRWVLELPETLNWPDPPGTLSITVTIVVPDDWALAQAIPDPNPAKRWQMVNAGSLTQNAAVASGNTTSAELRLRLD